MTNPTHSADADVYSRALALVVLDARGHLRNRWLVVKLLRLEFDITQTRALESVVAAARERREEWLEAQL